MRCATRSPPGCPATELPVPSPRFVLPELGCLGYDRVPGVPLLALPRDRWLPHGERIAAVLGGFLAATPPPPGEELSFSHNDLGIEHVLVDPGTFAVTGIIDWSDAAITDPACDFGRILRDLGPAALAVALRAYGEVSDGFAERVWCYARCGVIEDLAYGLSTGKDEYVDKSLFALSWLFQPVRARTSR